MTTMELADYIGRTATYRPIRSTLDVTVEILDARQSYGRVEFLIRPTTGSGESWIRLESLTIEGDAS